MEHPIILTACAFLMMMIGLTWCGYRLYYRPGRFMKQLGNSGYRRRWTLRRHRQTEERSQHAGHVPAESGRQGSDFGNGLGHDEGPAHSGRLPLRARHIGVLRHPVHRRRCDAGALPHDVRQFSGQHHDERPGDRLRVRGRLGIPQDAAGEEGQEAPETFCGFRFPMHWICWWFRSKPAWDWIWRCSMSPAN